MGNRIRKCLASMVAVGLCLSFAACGSSDSKADSSAKSVSDDKGESFQDIYDEIEKACSNKTTMDAIKVASDGSYIAVDTNPDNIDEGDIKYGDLEAYLYAFEQVNKKLGLSEATVKKMKEVRALDGTQTATDNGISVSYHYHPDQGLEVTYEKAN